MSLLYFTIALIASCGILVAILSTHSIYYLLWKDSSKWINKTYKNITIMMMIPFTLCIYGNLALIVHRRYGIHDRDLVYNILVVTKNAFYRFSDTIFYIFLLLRIAVPFDLSKSLIYTLSFIMFVSIIFSIIFIGYLPLSYPPLEYFDKKWKLYIIACLSGSDFLLNGVLLIIFVKQMKNILSHIDPSTSLVAERNVNLVGITLTKQALLFGIAIFSDQLYAIAIFCGYFAPISDDIEEIVIASSQVMEVTVNTVVLWLVLRINYDRYICLCQYFHVGVAKCCVKGMEIEQMVEKIRIIFQFISEFIHLYMTQVSLYMIAFTSNYFF